MTIVLPKIPLSTISPEGKKIKRSNGSSQGLLKISLVSGCYELTTTFPAMSSAENPTITIQDPKHASLSTLIMSRNSAASFKWANKSNGYLIIEVGTYIK